MYDVCAGFGMALAWLSDKVQVNTDQKVTSSSVNADRGMSA